MEVVVSGVGGFKRRMVRFRYHAVPDRPSLTPRRADPEDEVHMLVRFYFITIADSYWATGLVFESYAASGEGYKVSYGQVWLATLSAIEHILNVRVSSCWPYLPSSFLFCQQSILFMVFFGL